MAYYRITNHLEYGNFVRIVIISGRSGSGKSTALHVLEDAGFYCIDNLPAALLPPLVENMLASTEPSEGIAVSIDARNATEDLSRFNDILTEVKGFNVFCEIVFLDAKESMLVTRFSETRRKHPLSDEHTGLREAIQREKQVLEPLAELANIKIDTTNLNLYELRDVVQQRVTQHDNPGLALLFQSFGFKRGVPVDSDFVFDVRCLPNPHWHKELRGYTGQQQPVIDFLSQHSAVQKMQADIEAFLTHWLPNFAASTRTYLTVSIGCTGGQHRSVFLCEVLGQYFSDKFSNVQVRHRELSRNANI